MKKILIAFTFLINSISFSQTQTHKYQQSQEIIKQTLKLIESHKLKHKYQILRFFRIYDYDSDGYVRNTAEGGEAGAELVWSVLKENSEGFVKALYVVEHEKNDYLLDSILEYFSIPPHDGPSTDPTSILRELLDLQIKGQVDFKMNAKLMKALVEGYEYRCD